MLQIGEPGIIAAVNNIYFGHCTSRTEKFFTFVGIHLKTGKEIDSKFYKNEVTFIQRFENSPVAFTFAELEVVSQMLKNFVFIERFDNKYHEAIDDILIEGYVGLYMPGVEAGRFYSENTLIVLSTAKSIYAFDIVVMGRIKRQLKEILESNTPKKKVYDASAIADYLQHQKNIKLTGVFDTMVANCSLGLDYLSLNDCLAHHLKMPQNLVDEPIGEWHRRPLSNVNLRVAAENVAYLRKLHSHFTALMLKDLRFR